MGTLFLSVQGTNTRRRSGKPVFLLRKRRRATAIKLLAQLNVLENQEFAENSRSAINNYDPFLILGASNSRFSNAVALLKSRLQEALNAKA